MKIVVTIGIQEDSVYTEYSRCKIDVTKDTTISEVLELAKKNSTPMVPGTLQRHLEKHMYLMHPDTLERLDTAKTIQDYSLKDGDILRLMSGAR